MKLMTLLDCISNSHYVAIFDASGILLYADIAQEVPEFLWDGKVYLIKATDNETLEICMEKEL